MVSDKGDVELIPGAPSDGTFVKPDGDAVKRQEDGFCVTYKTKVTVPLAMVTVPTCMLDVVLAGKFAVIVAEPNPDEGEAETIIPE
jgi:hypothetical protein